MSGSEPLITIFEKNIEKFTSEEICELINEVYSLGLDRNIIGLCMMELVKRRENGERFEYETKVSLSPPPKPAEFDKNEFLQTLNAKTDLVKDYIHGQTSRK